VGLSSRKTTPTPKHRLLISENPGIAIEREPEAQLFVVWGQINIQGE